MAGHSHWANISRKKSLIDNKRGKLWSKLAKAIIVAAKMGGGDPAMNVRLRFAIDSAKAISMPKDNITRAVKAGTGETGGGNLEEMLYEGYGAGGVAVLCEILTDNRNRTAPEIRKIFEICDGKLGATGCVAWMFERKGLLLVPADKADEDKLMEFALEAGADDVKRSGDKFEVTCDPQSLAAVADALATRRHRAGVEGDRPHSDFHGGYRRSGHSPQGAQSDGAPRQSRRRAKRLVELQYSRRSDGPNRRRVSDRLIRDTGANAGAAYLTRSRTAVQSRFSTFSKASGSSDCGS